MHAAVPSAPTLEDLPPPKIRDIFEPDEEVMEPVKEE
jgi:hypothetical protein